MCHSRTENLEKYTKTADVVISAIEFQITKRRKQKRSILIDVGINRIDSDSERGYDIIEILIGTCNYKVFAITLFLGVGPMTICMLVEILLKQRKIMDNNIICDRS